MSVRPDLIRRQRAVPSRMRVQPAKVLVTGPFSAGKSTFIETISEVAVLGTEAPVTDATKGVKGHTTVAMDFGRLTFADSSLYLFGTPGQRRFEVMWEILSEGMIGFVLLVHAVDPRSSAEAAHILEAFSAYSDVPFVVGVTHLDRTPGSPTAAIDRVARAVALPPGTPIGPCDPRDRGDVKDALLQLLYRARTRLGGEPPVR